MDPTAFALSLFEIGAVKFGQFQLKSGAIAPVYVDLRGLISHPPILRQAGEAIVSVLAGLEFERIAGIPYAGLPLAVAASLASGRPMCYARKEAKEYGTARLIEGDFAAGERVVMLDDVITTGGAKIEGAAPFLAAGLRVRDFVVLVDREQGGRETLREHGYELHAFTTLPHILTALRDADRIDAERYDEVTRYLSETQRL